MIETTTKQCLDINDRDYYKTMSGDLFWVKDQVLSALNKLPRKCIVVMDNAPYHCVKRQMFWLMTKPQKKNYGL
jgi:hypothetical protein